MKANFFLIFEVERKATNMNFTNQPFLIHHQNNTEIEEPELPVKIKDRELPIKYCRAKVLSGLKVPKKVLSRKGMLLFILRSVMIDRFVKILIS
jgi:hypothetical protein